MRKIPEISSLLGYSDCGKLDLDALVSVRIFGGKTVEQAFEYICSGKECDYVFLESFHFMNSNAFWFYFPIFKKYLLWDTQKNKEVDIIVIKASIQFLLKQKSEIFSHLTEVIALIKILEKLIPMIKIEYSFEIATIKEIKFNIEYLKKYLSNF